jgi:DNA replication protein DnaC
MSESHDSDNNEENEDYLNRNLCFIATGYNKAILLDEETETYAIPTHEETTHRETVTYNDIINIVSNRSSAAEILNLVSHYQVKYKDYIKSYNKEGKLKYIKFRITKDIQEAKTQKSKPTGATESVIKRIPVWDVTNFTSTKTFTNVFFSDKDRILQQIRHFSTGEEFYHNRGIPWNLNILLYGVPGCGKTSFIKSLANMLKRHLIDLSLSAIKTTDDFQYVFNTDLFKDNYIPIDKRIIVLEDIDCMGSDILTDRSKLSSEVVPTDGDKENKMNLSCFLNTLDGIQEQNGRIIIATTNCIDTLDPAVLRRFNVKVYFSHLTKSLAQSIINNYYNCEVTIPEVWSPHNLTGASLTQLCMQFQDEPALLLKHLVTNFSPPSQPF